MKKVIAIKIGSSVLMTKRNKIDEFRIVHLVEQIQLLQQRGYGIVLVVSGAVASGSRIVQIIENDFLARQLAAGVGQVILISTLQKIFLQKNLHIAQILFTREQLQKRKIHVRRIINEYAFCGIIPIINENDVISLNDFGGNDILVVAIATIINASSVYILSTMQGSQYGIGGGGTKKTAVTLLEKNNIRCAILNGKAKNCLLKEVV